MTMKYQWSDLKMLETFMTNITFEDLSKSDPNVTYFVAGYIGRIITN